MDMTTFIKGFLAAYGLYWAFCGVATLITGKIYGYTKGMISKHTEESLHAAANLLGLANLVVGLAMIVPALCSGISALGFLLPYIWYILIVGVVVAFVLIVMGYKKLIKK